MAYNINSGSLLMLSGSGVGALPRVGIGTDAPSHILEVNSDTTAQGVVRINQHANDADASQLNITKGRGTHAAPAQVADGDYLGVINFQGYDGNSYDNFADIEVQAGTGVSTSAHPGKMVFRTVPGGSTTMATAMVIGSDQSISGSGVLHMVGAITSKGNITTSGSLAANTLDIGGSDAVITATGNISGSGTLQARGATTLGGTLNVSGATTMAGQLTVINGVDAEFLGNTTFGNAAADVITFTGKTLFNAPISSSTTFHNVGAATFGSTVAATGSVTAGTSFIIGSADINEVDLEKLDGITDGAGAANKALVLDGNADVASGLRSVTGSGDAKFANVHATNFFGSGTGLTGIGAASSVSGTTAQLTTGVETSGYLKVTGSSTLGAITATTYSGSSTLQVVGTTILGNTLAVSGASTLQAVTATSISSSGPITVTSLSASGESHFSGNVGIGTSTPLYDLHVNGAGATVITVDGGPGADAFVRFATNGTLKSYIKQGSGGNMVMLNEGNGGDVLMKASPGGSETTYLTLDGSTSTINTALPISGAGALHNVGAATFSSTIASTGSITAGTSFIIGSADLNEVDLEKLDGITDGAGAANKALVLDGNADVASGLRSITGSGDIKAANIHATQFYGGGAGLTGVTAGAPTSISGTTAQLTTGVETSGYLKVSGSSTFDGVATHTAHPIFDSGITIKNADASAGYINFYEQSSNGTNVCTFRGKSSIGNITITLPGDTGTVVLEDNTVTLSNKTISSPTITGVISSSATLHNVGAATFSSTVASTGSITTGGSVTSVGVFTTDIISGSAGIHVDLPATFGSTLSVTGNVSVGLATAITALDVHYDPTGISNDTGGGDVVEFGTGTTAAGKMYYLHSGSGWSLTDMIIPASGGIGLLSIALGTAPAGNGMLIRGFFDVHTYLTGTFAVGQPVYLGPAGYISTQRPSGSAEVVRVVGYCSTQSNVIYFNPSNEYIEIA
jgi:hypothetical protein